MKPCPFCGAKAFVDMIMTSQFTMWYVRCSNCLSSTAPKYTKEVALKQWNTRVNDEKESK